MRRAATLVLALSFAINTAPVVAAPAPAARAQAQGTGAIQGTAQSSAGQTLPNFTVQLRNVQTGQLAGSTTSNAAGSFSFTGLNPANYVIEVVNQAGAIVGTSSAVTVTAGATVTVTVTASAVGAAAGAGAAAAAAGGAGAAAGISTALIVTVIAAGAGVAAIVVAATQDEASPSR